VRGVPAVFHRFALRTTCFFSLHCVPDRSMKNHALLFLAPLSYALVSVPAFADGPDFSPTANVQYDLVRFDSDDTRLRDDDGFRRGRLGFKLKGDSWQFVAEHDVAERTPSDAFLELTPSKGHSVRIGQFKQPFLLEDAISDKQAPFLEQAPIGAFGVSRRLGVEYARQASWGTVNAALVGQRLDGTNEGVGVATRATWKLHERDGDVVHVGGGFASESPDTERASFAASPGTALTDVRLARTGTLRDVDRIDRAAVEALWIRGAWSLQGEHAQVAVQRDAARDAHGHAQTLLATWSPSGHVRSYKRGVPGAPAGDGRVWELSARWNAIDLDSGAVAGGHVQQLGLAATCYVNDHLRIAAKLVRSERNGARDAPLLAALRVQLTY
jgi:phosphate-selective porin OprO and OprP